MSMEIYFLIITGLLAIASLVVLRSPSLFIVNALLALWWAMDVF